MSRIIVYKKDSCPYCMYLKTYADSLNGVTIEYRDPDPSFPVKGYPYSIFMKGNTKVDELVGWNKSMFDEKLAKLK